MKRGLPKGGLCVALLALTANLCACNALLDIQNAHIDPRLEATADASTETLPATETDADRDAQGPDVPPDPTRDVAQPSDASTPADARDDALQPARDAATTPDPQTDGERTDSSADPGACAQRDASFAAGADCAPDTAAPEPSPADDSDDSDDSDQETEVPSAEPLDASSPAHSHSSEPLTDAAVPGEVPAEATVCEQYCADITELCTEELEQYRDLAQCLKVCSLLPQGTLGSEENENSAACRLRYAAKARYAAGTELSAYCRQAGPGGDGRCGTNCEGYCSLMMNVCTDETAAIYHFDDEEACLDACYALPTSSMAYSTQTEISDGNHVQCRLFHVTSAAMLDPEEHCEHALGLTLCEPVDESQ